MMLLFALFLRLCRIGSSHILEAAEATVALYRCHSASASTVQTGNLWK